MKRLCIGRTKSLFTRSGVGGAHSVARQVCRIPVCSTSLGIANIQARPPVAPTKTLHLTNVPMIEINREHRSCESNRGPDRGPVPLNQNLM